jgi:hypothetical protein
MLYKIKVFVKKYDTTVIPRHSHFAICEDCYWCASILIVKELGKIKQCPQCGASKKKTTMMRIVADTHEWEQSLVVV